MTDFLRRMARASARRAREARQRERESDLRRRALDRPPGLPLRRFDGGFDLIAEIKLRAPSAGALVPADDDSLAVALERARAYARGGASALSVLTEPEAFGGSLRHLETVAANSPLPTMRKDFLVDPYQLFETRAAGATGALLVLRILSGGRLIEMVDAAREAGLFVLLEAFDRRDLERAGGLVSRGLVEDIRALVGLNARDLTSLDVDRSRFEKLAGAFPAGVPRVAESGMTTAGHVRTVARLGYQAALVGSALMRAGSPVSAVAAMVAAGRDGRSERCA